MNKQTTIVLMFAVLAIFGAILYFQFFQDREKKVFLGYWEARWRTNPESFEGLEGITSYEMDGSFLFTRDSVTVVAKGFEGCVFGVDTLIHSQLWTIRNDTLSLVSEPGISGISYRVVSKSDRHIELQLLEDIFLSLDKAEHP